MKPKYHWIKERHNPQLGTYYVKCGPMTVREAKSYEGSRGYGSNRMLRFASEEEYHAKINELHAAGKPVQ